MFRWLLDLLSIKSEHRQKAQISFDGPTTEHYASFKKFDKLENPDRTEKEEDTMCRYICATDKSPFVGDDHLERATALLKKNSVPLEKVFRWRGKGRTL